MADLKISQLPAATVPLAGTEVLPIVQSGSTVQVSITNVLAGAASFGANTFTAAQEWATGTAIASATTVNLNTATGNRVHITGTTTITAVTLTRGPRTVIFDGILTLTHNATTNNLPGAANITTAAGDRAIYESDGTTVYCVSYIKASGTAVKSGGLLRTTYITTAGSGTYTKPADTVSILVKTIAGGGGGGDDNGTTGGSGGGAGSYAIKYIAVAASSYAYTVGAGGAGGTGGTAGSAGGETTIAGIAGGAGYAGLAGGTSGGGSPSFTTGGDLNTRGAVGNLYNSTSGGNGGASVFGGNSKGGGAGVAAVLGAGGNGAGQAETAGGNGGAGYIEIQEYS